MGAKTWLICLSDGKPVATLLKYPPLDRDASDALARKLFPGFRLEALTDADLLNACPPEDQVMVGCYPGLTLIAASDLALDNPSQLESRFHDAAPHCAMHLVAMHSVVDWLAFAVWRDGRLQRALSVAPDSGIVEEVGPRLPFELPYWSGEHPANDPDDEEDDYPLPFHPLEMGEAVLQEFFGYQIEGAYNGSSDLDPNKIALLRYRRIRTAKPAKTKPWWKIW